MIISTEDFKSFLNKLSKGYGNFSEVVLPFPTDLKKDDEPVYRFKKLNGNNGYVLNSFRTIDPIKILIYLTREKVYPLTSPDIKRIIAGVKACDLKALSIMDKAMLQSGFEDPAYKKWRDNTLIISSDCHKIHKTCNCTSVGGNPFAEVGYDINVSQLNGYIHFTAGTDRGNDFVALMKKDFDVKESTKTDEEDATRLREKTLEMLAEKNNEQGSVVDYSDFRSVSKEIWNEKSVECIGCGACTNICPTCYCLILNDESKQKDFVKVRSYDSCQWHGYARVAGGASPRPKMTERFRNRYLCKFDYMQKNFGEIGCTGCGRCTEACAGKIRFMEVAKSLNTKKLETVS